MTTPNCNTFDTLQGFCATPGYDRVTGIGSPVWENLLLPQQPFQTIYQFGGPEYTGTAPDGGGSQARLLAFDGDLYGTTNGGGAYGCGTVFEIIPPLNEKLVYSFKCGQDGSNPSDLVNVDGVLYGTTEYGGTYNNGTVYKIDRLGNKSVIHNFNWNKEGAYPAAGLINVGGVLYGTTEKGTKGYGTVFSMTTSGVERWLWNFSSIPYRTDAAFPEADLLYVNNALYGTAAGGGTTGGGAVFKINTNGTGESVVYSFGVTRGDGSSPAAPLIANANGELYGTTNGGGSSGHGAVFAMSTTGTGEKLLYNFGDQLYSVSHSGMVYLNGFLYGTTYAGGMSDNGYLYRLTLPSGAPTILQTFNQYGKDGGFPESQLINVDGTLYGTTSGGGWPGWPNGGSGTVFDFTP